MSAARDRIVGIRPVEEAIAAGVAIAKILVAEGRHLQLEALVVAATSAHIPVERRPRSELDRLSGGVRHQGVVAEAEPYRYRPLEELIGVALGVGEAGASRPLIVADGISDPQNVGAILRAIEVAGAAGLVVGEHRAAGVTPAARKASAGAADHVAVAKVTNVVRAIEQLKGAGFWILGLEADGDTDLYAADLAGPLGLVVGSEGSGLSRLAREHCDVAVSISMAGSVGSLNVAQSVTVVLFEWRRRRLAGAQR